MGESRASKNKSANNKVDAKYIIWLGRWFLFQTFDDEVWNDKAGTETAMISAMLCDNGSMIKTTNPIKHIWFDVNGTLCLYTPEYNQAHDKLRYEAYGEVTDREVSDELKDEYERLYSEYGSNSPWCLDHLACQLFLDAAIQQVRRRFCIYTNPRNI